MRHQTPEELRIQALAQKLRARIAAVGRWHSKRRKADSTRIWKKLFLDIEQLVTYEQHPFTHSAFIILTIYPNEDKYLLQVHLHNRTLYHGLRGKREKDYLKVIKELNAVLTHYNLVLIETPESAKGNNARNFNAHKEYEVKFANYN